MGALPGVDPCVAGKVQDRRPKRACAEEAGAFGLSRGPVIFSVRCKAILSAEMRHTSNFFLDHLSCWTKIEAKMGNSRSRGIRRKPLETRGKK